MGDVDEEVSEELDELAEVEAEIGTFDAPLGDKDAWLVNRAGAALPLDDPRLPEALRESLDEARVRFAGEAATAASGPRGLERGAHNWIPTGPRNVGGRVRALAVDPNDSDVIYAGSASGGVWKTRDGGETWVPLWHEQPSLSVGAIAVAPSNSSIVYVATGEIDKIPGKGITRSTDGGETWSEFELQGFRDRYLEAIAVHPTNPEICWAVGPKGAYRTTNGGGDWTIFDEDTYYSDVVFALDPGPDVVFFVRAETVFHERANLANPPSAANAQRAETYVVRVENANARADVTAALRAAANRSIVNSIVSTAADPVVKDHNEDRWPKRGKIAISKPGAADTVAYVRFANSDKRRRRGGHAGLWRSDNFDDAPGSSITWTRLAEHEDWEEERQGAYNLCLAVDPGNADHVVTGMVELYVTTTATTIPAWTAAVPHAPAGAWKQAMSWTLYALDRGHHADQHALVFVPQPGQDARLWVGNDGGISMSSDWRTGVSHRRGSAELPLPDDAITWRKRSHGILAAQCYDVSQSPLIPTLYGCGFQDNGVRITTGGGSWSFVFSADGGFVAFDPDDPYRFYGTWQSTEGIAEVYFPGGIGARVSPVGYGVQSFLWPREIDVGFLPVDEARFEAMTLCHPTRSRRILLCRKNRLYGTRDGETWSVEQIGHYLELLYDSGGETSTLEILPTDGAWKLGFLPQASIGEKDGDDPALARCLSIRRGPFNLTAGDTIEYRLDNAAATQTITFAAGPLIGSLGAATPAEVAEFIRANGQSHLFAAPRFPSSSRSVQVATTARGANTELTIGANPPADLDVAARTYDGAADWPATLSLAVAEADLDGKRLEITVGSGGAVRGIDFSAANLSDPEKARAAEVSAAVAAALAPDDAFVTDAYVIKKVLLSATAAGASVSLSGTAEIELTITPGSTKERRRIEPGVSESNTFNLAPENPGDPDLELEIGDGTNTHTVTFSAADLPTRENATAEELVRLIGSELAGAAPALNVRCDLELVEPAGGPEALAFGRDQPDTILVGGTSGTLFRSTNDGRSWTEVTAPGTFPKGREIGVVAIDPTNDRVFFVGFYGWGGRGNDHFLFRSGDAGRSWTHVGDGVVDGDDDRIGIQAIEINPANPQEVFVATFAGVFRSANGGDDWSAFNQGLPNTRIIDLAFVPATQVLRAATWGRGTYERYVGGRLPRDVQLYIRAHLLDDGAERPPAGGSDALALRPRQVGLLESPDIKVSRIRPPQVGPDEQVDGVEFDEEIEHLEPGAGDSLVFVQVHNRGAFPAEDVRVVALWAAVGDTPPTLPEGFWESFSGGGGLELGDDWALIGDFTFADTPPGQGRNRVAVATPRVHAFEYEWPPVIGTLGEIAILVLVHCAADPLETSERDVGRLLETETKAACRVTRTRLSEETTRIRLQRTGPARFSLAAPDAPATDVLGALGLAAGGPVDEATGGNGPFDLSAGASRGFKVTLSQAVEITFEEGQGLIGNMSAATAFDVGQSISRALRLQNDVPLRVHAAKGRHNFSIAYPNVEPPGTQLEFDIPGGSARALLITAASIAALPRDFANGRNEPYNLAPLAPPHLTVTMSQDTDVLFVQGPGEIADLSNASAEEVQRVIDRRLRGQRFAVRCRIGDPDPRMARSVTGSGDPLLRLGGGHLADVVAGPATVAPADRPALFDLVLVHGADRLAANAANFLNLRVRNEGTVEHGDARVRLYALTPGNQIGVDQIGDEQTGTVPAGDAAYVEFEWPAQGFAADAHPMVLAVVDDDQRRPLWLPVPPSFQDFAELDAFCLRHTGAAYRVFDVGP